MQSGKPCPKVRCSDIAKELEREFGELEPQEIYRQLGERLKEVERKRKELELRIDPSTEEVADVFVERKPTSESSTPPSSLETATTTRRGKRKTMG